MTKNYIQSVELYGRDDDGNPVPVVAVETNIVHNYFPNGAITDDALIDVDGDQDYDVHMWQGNWGSETLTRSPAASNAFFARPTAFDAVKVACPGNVFDEGVIAADWSGRYGEPSPAGHYRIGCTIRLSTPVPILVQPVARIDGNSASLEYVEWLYPNPRLLPARLVMNLYLYAPGYLGLAISTTNQAPLDGAHLADPIAVDIYVGHVMVTEGDPAIFADGDSPGWSWSGTPHASSSSGPQP